MQEKKTRGYDDDAKLTEMALGIVTQKYNSVDEAAKSVIGDAHPSNAERLRRKFRDQNWYETGLRLYVEAEMQRRDAMRNTDTQREIAAIPEKTFDTMLNRIGRWMRVPTAAAILGSLVLVASYQIGPTAAAVDPVKAALAERAEGFATHAVTALYTLTFEDPDKQIGANQRFFLTSGAYDHYVKDIVARKLPYQVRRNLLVLQNEVVTDPVVDKLGGDHIVRFTMRQTEISSYGAKKTCLEVLAFVYPNKRTSLGTSEFGFMAAPRMTTVECPWTG